MKIPALFPDLNQGVRVNQAASVVQQRYCYEEPV